MTARYSRLSAGMASLPAGGNSLVAKSRREKPPSRRWVREIREELETTVSVDSFVYQVEYDYPAFHLSMGCYMCSIVEGHLHLLEHSAAKWLGAANLRSVDWLPADIEVVNALEAKGVLS